MVIHPKNWLSVPKNKLNKKCVTHSLILTGASENSIKQSLNVASENLLG